MNATPESLKDPEVINIEIDGVPLKARRGDMIIEVADAAGIDIPRFCYHKKLSIAANCRMCLIEVEKVPKPLPACATPVTEGMKVYTRSPRAIEAQKGTMEFLLINHPLDCPICDQGGECDLQEMSVGYGADHSEYREPKRVVRDKDIGPLIETEMTRCIHCTRCVRFGEEIAGLKELGATGRGENMRIGTYVERAVTSELSGNVIDLCPVGALTSKPFRFTARAWELQRHPSVAPHDCVGSNLTVLVRGHKVMRVDPRENEAINEVWLSDRDRFSYEALNSEERLLTPMIRRDGRWEETDWNTALEQVVQSLGETLRTRGAGRLGTLVSPSATLEEMYLAQQLTRGLGSPNIDHRLRQVDFRNQEHAPPFPWLGQNLADLEQIEAALLIGCNVRKDQPLVAHRLRKAARRGAGIMFLNPVAYDPSLPVAENLAAGPAAMVRHLAAIAGAVHEEAGAPPPEGLDGLLHGVRVEEAHRRIAARLCAARRGTVLLGLQAVMHPAYSTLQALAGAIAEAAQLPLGCLSEGANTAGAWLAGVLPHRMPGGEPVAAPGWHAREMLTTGLDAYLLVNVEPEFEAAAPRRAVEVLGQAECVVALSPFKGGAMQEYADIMLPIAPFSETSGTYVNAEGRWQSFAGAVPPAGEARPAWKVLRVLGNVLGVDGFDYLSSEEVRAAVAERAAGHSPSNRAVWSRPERLDEDGEGPVRVAHVPIYSVDNIVRRAEALQQTEDARSAAVIRLGRDLAQRLGLEDGMWARAIQGAGRVELPVVIDDRVAPGCVLIPAGLAETRVLDAQFGPIELQPVGGGQARS